jgi:hypothetical protein
MIINTPVGFVRIPMWINNMFPFLLGFLVFLLYILMVYFIHIKEAECNFILNENINKKIFFQSII